MKWREYFFFESAIKNGNWKGHLLLALTFSTIISLSGCESCEEDINPPGVTTLPVSEITASNAKGGGRVNDAGGGTIKSRGLVWDLNHNPTIGNCAGSTNEGSGLGTFSCALTDLSHGTTYYVRAYASNEEGPGYGEELSFTTFSVEASLTTAPVVNITHNSARSGGSITDDGGAPITERGICWSESPGPTTANKKIVWGAGTGDFTCELTGLKRYTDYYLRAYAINSAGTSYGNEISFRTEAETPKLSRVFVFNATDNSAKSGVSIADDGGAPITARGVCWSTSPNPTTASKKSTDGTGVGSYSSTLSGLDMGSLYYVRAYATNEGDKTGYSSNEVAFLTLLKDVEGNTYKVVKIGQQIWMAENLRTTIFNDRMAIPLVADCGGVKWGYPSDGILKPAYCWYNCDHSQYAATYGALYNWYTVGTGKLCPTGWHVPSDEEWTTLTDYLGGASVAGGALKEEGTAHWRGPNTGATNSSGFTGVPGGNRAGRHGCGFAYLGDEGYWWSLTRDGDGFPWFRRLKYNDALVFRGSKTWGRPFGFSVRCLKD